MDQRTGNSHLQHVCLSVLLRMQMMQAKVMSKQAFKHVKRTWRRDLLNMPRKHARASPNMPTKEVSKHAKLVQNVCLSVLLQMQIVHSCR